MRLDSVQIASAREVDVGGRAVRTGIDKRPVTVARVTRDGLVGDVVVNTRHHGGPDQAVYVFSREDSAWWEAELGRRLDPGTFGENLTFDAFGVAAPRVGDRWQIGSVLLETTAPRIPCATLGARIGDPAFPARFREARRPGFYARVIVGGSLGPGASVVRLPSAHALTVVELADLFADAGAEPSRVRAALEAPIAARARELLRRRLGDG